VLAHALLGTVLHVLDVLHVLGSLLAGIPPDDTVNEFLPTERGLGECISALPKPGCGSEARGGWRQWLVFCLLIAGLLFIVWRVWAAARKARTAAPRDSHVERTP